MHALIHVVIFVTGPSSQAFVVQSAAGFSGSYVFPAGMTSARFMFTITDDNVGLEDIEMYLATLSLGAGAAAAGAMLGARAQATVAVVDDDGQLKCIQYSTVVSVMSCSQHQLICVYPIFILQCQY